MNFPVEWRRRWFSAAKRGEWQAAIALARFVYNSSRVMEPSLFAPCLPRIWVQNNKNSLRVRNP